jgi:hypothetical protein
MNDEFVLRAPIDAPLQLDIQHIGGDLILEGNPSDELLISGEGAHLERLAEDTLRLECGSDCHVRVPRMVSVRVRDVAGDLRATALMSALQIERCQADLIVRTLNAPLQAQRMAADARITEVNGDVQIGSVCADLVLRDINGAVAIDHVGADLDIKRVSGACDVRFVGADACFKDVRGALNIAHVDADLVLTDLLADCAVEQIGADLVLDVPFLAGRRYRFGAVGADVRAKIRSGSAAIFSLPSGTARTIQVRGVQLVRKTDCDILQVGECAENCAEVTFEAIGGDLQLVSQGKGFSSTLEFSLPENLGELISSQISQQLSRLEQTLSRQAERTVRRAAERAKKHGGRASRLWMWSGMADMPPPPVPPHPPAPPRRETPAVTEAERMAILRMVEEHKITIDEAERLLAALEGRG